MIPDNINAYHLGGVIVSLHTYSYYSTLQTLTIHQKNLSYGKLYHI